MCTGPGKQPRGNLRSLWTNLVHSDAPLLERLESSTRNYLRRFRGARTCCGHYGEPGC